MCYWRIDWRGEWLDTDSREEATSVLRQMDDNGTSFMGAYWMKRYSARVLGVEKLRCHP